MMAEHAFLFSWPGKFTVRLIDIEGFSLKNYLMKRLKKIIIIAPSGLGRLTLHAIKVPKRKVVY